MKQPRHQPVEHDHLFKEVLRVCFVDFLELFLPEVVRYLDVKSVEFIEQESFGEITANERRAVDLLVKARFRGQPTYFLIHTEVQAGKRGWSPKRMFYYFAVQSYKHDLPVYPIALLSWDSPRAAEPGQYKVEFPDRRVLEFNFAVIQLNRLDWRDYLQRDNPAASALMAKMGVEPQERPKVRAACLRMLARLRLPEKQRWPLWNFIDAYLPLTIEQATEFEAEVDRFEPKEKEAVMDYATSYATTWKQEGLEKGLAIGLEKGKLEGKLEGKTEGKLEILLTLLTQRLGSLNEATIKRMGRLSLESVELLLNQLLDFKQPSAFASKAELDRWLRVHVPARRVVNGKH